MQVASQDAVQLQGRFEDGGFPGVGGGTGTGEALVARGRDASIAMPQMPEALTFLRVMRMYPFSPQESPHEFLTIQ